MDCNRESKARLAAEFVYWLCMNMESKWIHMFIHYLFSASKTGPQGAFYRRQLPFMLNQLMGEMAINDHSDEKAQRNNS